MAKKTKKLVRAGVALAATTLAEAALQEAARNPRVRRKAKEMAVSTGRAIKRKVRNVAAKRKRKGSAKAARR